MITAPAAILGAPDILKLIDAVCNGLGLLVAMALALPSEINWDARLELLQKPLKVKYAEPVTLLMAGI